MTETIGCAEVWQWQRQTDRALFVAISGLTWNYHSTPAFFNYPLCPVWWVPSWLPVSTVPSSSKINNYFPWKHFRFWLASVKLERKKNDFALSRSCFIYCTCSVNLIYHLIVIISFFNVKKIPEFWMDLTCW